MSGERPSSAGARCFIGLELILSCRWAGGGPGRGGAPSAREASHLDSRTTGKGEAGPRGLKRLVAGGESGRRRTRTRTTRRVFEENGVCHKWSADGRKLRCNRKGVAVTGVNAPRQSGISAELWAMLSESKKRLLRDAPPPAPDPTPATDAVLAAGPPHSRFSVSRDRIETKRANVKKLFTSVERSRCVPSRLSESGSPPVSGETSVSEPEFDFDATLGPLRPTPRSPASYHELPCAPPHPRSPGCSWRSTS